MVLVNTMKFVSVLFNSLTRMKKKKIKVKKKPARGKINDNFRMKNNGITKFIFNLLFFVSF